MTTRPIRNFNEMLGTLNRGKFADKCDEELTRAIEALETLPDGRCGSATLTMTVTLSFDGERMDVKPAIKSKLPEGKAFTSTTFWTYEGGLSVQHPSQHDMFAGPRVFKDQATGSAG